MEFNSRRVGQLRTGGGPPARPACLKWPLAGESCRVRRENEKVPQRDLHIIPNIGFFYAIVFGCYTNSTKSSPPVTLWRVRGRLAGATRAIDSGRTGSLAAVWP